MLTRIESELDELMWSRGVDLHTRMYIAIVLGNDSNRRLMIRWIKKNPSVGQCEILSHSDVLRPVPPPGTVQFVPRKTHKIAKAAMF